MCCSQSFDSAACQSPPVQDSTTTSTSKQCDIGILIVSITSKAYHSLNLIHYSQFQYHLLLLPKSLFACLQLARSHIKYCSQIWRPHLLKDIKMLERDLRRAPKLISSDCPTSTYREQLVTLHLMCWLEIQDVMLSTTVKALKRTCG